MGAIHPTESAPRTVRTVRAEPGPSMSRFSRINRLRESILDTVRPAGPRRAPGGGSRPRPGGDRGPCRDEFSLKPGGAGKPNSLKSEISMSLVCFGSFFGAGAWPQPRKNSQNPRATRVAGLRPALNSKMGQWGRFIRLNPPRRTVRRSVARDGLIPNRLELSKIPNRLELSINYRFLPKNR